MTTAEPRSLIETIPAPQAIYARLDELRRETYLLRQLLRVSKTREAKKVAREEVAHATR